MSGETMEKETVKQGEPVGFEGKIEELARRKIALYIPSHLSFSIVSPDMEGKMGRDI